MKDQPPSPPIVHVGDEIMAYLLAWERHERDGSWWAWVTWIRTQGDRPFRHVVTVGLTMCGQLNRPRLTATYRAECSG